MSKEDIEKLKAKLYRISCMEAVIESAKNNIDAHNRVFKGKEILIQDNTNKTNPIYITGEMKDRILELLNINSNKIIKEWEQKIKDCEI